MKKIIFIFMVFIIVFNPMKVHAETFAEWCQRKQKEADADYIERLEKDGNLTDDAIKSIDGKNSKKKANKVYKSKNNKSNNYSSKSDEINKGYVYSTDELHVIGLPEDERGYTKAGDYGKINSK